MAARRLRLDQTCAQVRAGRVIWRDVTGRISGVQRFGAFVALDETGADGLIPVRSIGREYFRYDDKASTLKGEESGLTLAMGSVVTVRLAEAEPVTGGLMLELLEVNGIALPKTSGRPMRGGPRRKVTKAKRKSDKIKRKVSRSRK